MADSKILNILVTGAFNSGKTAFIQQISETAVRSVEREIGEISVALDWGPLTIDKSTWIYLFGTSAGMPFKPNVHQSFFATKPISGIVLVVRATRKIDWLQQEKYILENMRTSKIPYVIVLNCYDAEAALPEQEVRDAIEATPSEIIVKCNANSRVEARDALLMLIKQMPEDNVIKKVRTRLMQL
jgi:uncharacterized protein